MKLSATTTSERGKEVLKTANELIIIELKHNRRYFARLAFSFYKSNETEQEHFRLYYQPENEKGYKELLKHVYIDSKSKETTLTK